MTFDEWFAINRSFVENEITARNLWDSATYAERERCKQKCEELMTETNQPYEDDQNTYADGWVSACNECKCVISGCVPKSEVFTAAELCEPANIGKAYFENNKPIDIQLMGDDGKYYQKFT